MSKAAVEQSSIANTSFRLRAVNNRYQNEVIPSATGAATASFAGSVCSATLRLPSRTADGNQISIQAIIGKNPMVIPGSIAADPFFLPGALQTSQAPAAVMSSNGPQNRRKCSGLEPTLTTGLMPDA